MAGKGREGGREGGVEHCEGKANHPMSSLTYLTVIHKEEQRWQEEMEA